MSRVPSRATSPAPPRAGSSSSSDLSSAWHAHAPPLPPPSPSSASRPRSRGSSLVPSSTSQSLEFDAATRGGTLPSDTFSPEPERPVSPRPPPRGTASANDQRSATARPLSSQGFYNDNSAAHHHGSQHVPQSYDRGVTQHQADGSTASGAHDRNRTSSGTPMGHSWQHPQHAQPHHHQRSSSRVRYDSSPTTPSVNYGHPAYGHAGQQQAMNGYEVGMSHNYGPLGGQPPTGYGTVPPTAPHHANAASPQYVVQRPYNQHNIYTPAPTQGSPGQQPAQNYAYPHAPATYPGWQASGPAQPAPHTAPHHAAPSAPHTPFSDPHLYQPHHAANAPQPFPSMGQNTPTLSYAQPGDRQAAMPPSTSTPNSRPLPQPTTGPHNPGRSPSLPTHAPLAGTTALFSAPSVRRDLPQPPPGASPAPPAARVASVAALPGNGTLSRADSQRMAAEALMARGPPRRERGSVASSATLGRAALHNAISTVHPAHAVTSPSQQSSAFATGNAKGLANSDGNDASRADLVEAFSNVHVSPRESEYAHPAPRRSHGDQSNMEAPAADQPARPASRGPRDDIKAGRERRLSSHGSALFETQGPAHTHTPATIPSPQQQQQQQSGLATASTIPTIFSPPPDERPAVPIIDFGDAPPTSPTKTPTILVGAQDEEVPLRRGSPRKASSTNFDAPKTTISVTPAAQESTSAAPRIALSGPEISVSGAGDDEDEAAADPVPKASISISHSGPLATPQRASAEPAPASQSGRPLQPQAASAPTLGSGFACGACHKWIGGRVVSAMNQRFHPACFKCSHCSEALEHVAFYEHEGKPFCHFDYHELFSRRCFHCRTPIVDERFITISDPELVGAGTTNGTGTGTGAATERSYHDLHFFCANCGDPFIDPKAAGSVAGADPQNLSFDENGNLRAGAREFVVWKGYPYCEKCHIQLHKPRCKGCRLPIVDGDVITALKAKWHPHCFTCEGCKRPFESPNFFIRGNKAYDEECYKVMLRNEL